MNCEADKKVGLMGRTLSGNIQQTIDIGRMPQAITIN